jgi:thioredoxin 1
MATYAVTDATFSDDVLNSSTPVLLDFWAEWCGPCKKMGPALEDVSDEFEGRIKIAKMDIQENPDTPGKFHVRGIPTLMIFKEGQVVATKVGEMSKTKLSEWLAEYA